MIAVDTNIISALLKGNRPSIPAEELYLPFMVMAELQAGIGAMPAATTKRAQLQEFLDDPNLTISPGLAPEVIPCYAQIYSFLKINGTSISANDLWIAAECMQLSLPLLTFDTDFARVPQIIVLPQAS